MEWFSRIGRSRGGRVMSDTRNDYRLLVAEHAVDLLEKIVAVKAIPVPTNWGKASVLVREVRGIVKRMRYSFLPATMLARSSDAERLKQVVKDLASLLFPQQWAEELKRLKKNRLQVAEAKYALRTLYGLPSRLALGDDNNVYYAVDVECVRIVSVEKHPSAKNLFVTHATGIYRYVIVTNIADMKRGEVRAAAILPPREFGGIVSEAMYCSDPLGEECNPGKRAPREAVRVGEVAAVIDYITRKYR